ncbi:class I SAM-dependent methyltransferase [Mediterraneibacter sp. ICN-202921]|uniref:class I SAM-dependent methyltransferase n=1 Tax=Mediterraneibacter sp. ICN-202921 TaxID=3134657 RepID=UPI0030C2AD50
MDELKKILETSLDINFVRAVISNPRVKGEILKVKVRPIEKKGSLYFQFEAYTKTQVFHENVPALKAAERILSYMHMFRQMQMTAGGKEYTVLVSKKGKMTVTEKRNKDNLPKVDLSHNRSKKYILEEGKAVPFLVDLGVMTKEGKVVHAKFDKFRQINRFLEFIEDILPQLDKDKELTILDFGCGKSYLTFAIYYYLHELKGYDIKIIGLDLKQEVIAHCSRLAVKYGYEKLSFLRGDIAEYTGVDRVDMVVTLHACDTATDHALAKAIGWNAKVILSVPCCQHELNRQIGNEDLSPILDYGLLKERMAALVTDGLRAKYLEREGYESQILEFIDMEHTPKNILIRAVKKASGCDRKKAAEEIRRCEELLCVHPVLGTLLDEKRRNK